jgi:hypothetical protein
MKIKTIAVAAGLAVASVGCGAAAHQQSRASELQCAHIPDASQSVSESLLSGSVYRAEPIHFERFYAGGPQADHVIGARLYVPAPAGQDDAYLERAMACHLASGRTAEHASDPLGVDGVRSVDVRSSGASFEVSIVGGDQESGEAIWQRARSLAGQVGVHQVASNGTTAAF